jgi:hypothetical protein
LKINYWSQTGRDHIKGALFHAKREIGTSKNWNICAAITRAKDDLVKFYQIFDILYIYIPKRFITNYNFTNYYKDLDLVIN